MQTVNTPSARITYFLFGILLVIPCIGNSELVYLADRFQGNYYESAEAACSVSCNHHLYPSKISGLALDCDNAGFCGGPVTCENHNGDEWVYWRQWQISTLVINGTDLFFADLNDLQKDDQGNGPNSNSSCNPINLINGNKYKVHTDIASSLPGGSMYRPGFSRIYNSQAMQATGNTIGVNWRHSYQRRVLSRDILNTEPHLFTGSIGAMYDPLQSNLKSTKQLACEEGFSEVLASDSILLDIYPWLSSGIALWINDACRIYVDDRYVTSISIKTHGTGGGTVILDQVIRVYRADGKEYLFRKSMQTGQLNNWLRQSQGTTVTLEMTVIPGTPDPENPGLVTDTILYIYTDENDIRETYASTGELLRIDYPNGVSETLSYNPDNTLDRVDNNLGKFITLTYTPDGLVGSVSDDTLRTWTYEYDTELRLVKVTNPDASEKQYHYEDTNQMFALTGESDERGIRFGTFDYYANGKAKTSYLGTPGALETDKIDKVSVTYTPTFNTVTDSRNNITTLNFLTNSEILKGLVTQIDGPSCMNCSLVDRTIDYDIADINPEYSSLNVLSSSAFGVSTEFGNYLSAGNPGYVIEALGQPEEQRRDFTYDTRFQSEIETITETSVEIGQNKIIALTRDNFKNITTLNISGFKPGGTAVSRTTNLQYNGPFNQLSQVDGPRVDISDITTFSYYPDDPAEGNNRARLKNVLDANGIYVRSNIQYTATGQVSSEDRTNNLHIDYSYYPGNDRLELQTLIDQVNGKQRVTRWTHLATGEVSTVTSGFGTADATTITMTYDNARRLTRITDGLGNYIKYMLDTEGNVESEDTYDAGNILHKSLGQTFDAYNRLDTSTQANEISNPQFNEDGTLDFHVDGNSVTTAYSYDALKRLTSTVQDLNGTDPTTANATTSINYDSQDNLVSLADANGGVTSYIYDDLGNMLQRTSPDTGTTFYTHDEAGNVTSVTDAKGQVFTYTYDLLNRVTTIDAPGIADDVAYTYDDCANGSGRLCAISNSDAVVHHQYDAFGNITSQQSIQYAYDNADRVKTIAYPSGAQLTYTYDMAARVDAVNLTRNGTTVNLASSISYEPFGPVATMNYGNGHTLTQVRDLAYREQSQIISSVMSLDYPLYDANGNLQQIDDNLSGQTETFTYDAHDRLDTASGGFGSRDYEYDINSNRTQLNDGTVTTYSYTPNSNRMTQQNGSTVQLDANGNTMVRGNQNLNYTSLNRLRNIIDNGNTLATYSYNGLGQRITKLLADGTGQRFIYDPDGSLLVVTDISGNVLHEYVYLNGQLLARYDVDTDKDGITNAREASAGTNPSIPDDDNDGLSNYDELFIHGTAPDKADTDGDGVGDATEITLGTNPLDANAIPDLPGDINLDGTVNVGDYILMQQFVLGTRTPNPSEFTQADLNLDNQVNIQDLMLLLQSILNVSFIDSLLDAWHHAEQLLADTADIIIPNAWAAIGDGEIYYIHLDHLGTPQVLTNEPGTRVWSASYDPFGKATVNEDPDGNGIAVTFNVRFPGQYYDAESGLHYNYFRTYDPETGRYLESDPIGLDGGTNTYGYAYNNPLYYTDPNGLLGAADFPTFPNLGDFSAGFGDTLTSGFGLFDDSLTAFARDKINSRNSVNKCSAAYKGGKFAGYTWGVAATWAGGLSGGANSVFFAGLGTQGIARNLGTTIDKTLIGGILTGLKVNNRIAWKAASITFAANAKQGSKAVIRYVHPRSIWNTERAILKWRGIHPIPH